MKKTQPYSLFRTILLTLLFFVGLQITMEAQFRLINNTSCTVFFKVGQQNNLTANPCDLCNTTGIIAVPSGGFYIHPAQATCGPQFWLAFKYYTNLFGGSGASYNPGLAGACGNDIIGSCGFNLINVNWFLLSATGAGPATVVLN